MRRWWWAALGLVVLPWLVSAEVEGWRAFDFFKLTGGLNDAFESTSLDPSEASDLQNVVFKTSGAITKRSGFARINNTALTSTPTITGLAFYKQADGDRFLAALASTSTSDKFYTMAYNAGTAGPTGSWVDRTGSTVLSFTNDQPADFATAFDNLIIEDGNPATAPYVWTGSGNLAALGGSPPNSTMVEFHRQHLFTAGRLDFQSRVSFSNLDDITTWTSTDYIEVETDDGQVITGLKSFYDCLYVFKTDSIWRICGPERDNFVREQMVKGLGAASNQSIVLINNRMLFLTSQGNIAVYDGDHTVQIISSKIKGTLGQLNLQRLSHAVAVPFDDGTGNEDYYLALSTQASGTNDLVLVYNTLHQAWTKFAGITANAMTLYETGTAQRAIGFGDYLGYANRYPSGTSDAGSAITAYYQTGQLRFPEIPSLKKFRQAQLFVLQTGGGNLSFGTSVNFAAISTSTVSLSGNNALWDTARWDQARYGDTDSVIRRKEINKEGDFLLWRVDDTGTSTPFVVRGVRIWVEDTGRLGG